MRKPLTISAKTLMEGQRSLARLRLWNHKESDTAGDYPQQSGIEEDGRGVKGEQRFYLSDRDKITHPQYRFS